MMGKSRKERLPELSRLEREIMQVVWALGECSSSEVIAAHPLRYGLSELVAYFEVTSRWKRVDVSDDVQEKVAWRGEDGVDYRATMPRVIILRN